MTFSSHVFGYFYAIFLVPADGGLLECECCGPGRSQLSGVMNSFAILLKQVDH